MKIQQNNQTFQAIRVPLKKGEQADLSLSKKVVEKIKYFYRPQVINADEHKALFFKNPETDEKVMEILDMMGISYNQSFIIDKNPCSMARKFWTKTGIVPIEYKSWIRQN